MNREWVKEALGNTRVFIRINKWEREKRLKNVKLTRENPKEIIKLYMNMACYFMILIPFQFVILSCFILIIRSNMLNTKLLLILSIILAILSSIILPGVIGKLFKEGIA